MFVSVRESFIYVCVPLGFAPFFRTQSAYILILY